MGSRNGTQVNGRTLLDEHILTEGDAIVVAGCQMKFVLDLAQAFTGQNQSGNGEQVSSSHTVALGEEPPVIVGRLAASRWSAPRLVRQAATMMRCFLYRLVFEMVSISGAGPVAQCALDRLLDRIGVAAGGVLLLSAEKTGPGPEARTKPTRLTSRLHQRASPPVRPRCWPRVFRPVKPIAA